MILQDLSLSKNYAKTTKNRKKFFVMKNMKSTHIHLDIHKKSYIADGVCSVKMSSNDVL